MSLSAPEKAVVDLLFFVAVCLFLWIWMSARHSAEKAKVRIARFVASQGGSLKSVTAGPGGRAFGVFDVVFSDAEGRERRGICRVWFKVKWISAPT